jgi:hypothetical protein
MRCVTLTILIILQQWETSVSAQKTDVPVMGASDPGRDEAAPQVRDHEQPERLLVLNSGRVVKGRLVPRVDGYDLTVPNGRMFVASAQVRFPADNLQDAYSKMRDTLPNLTPQTHLELAQWCVAQGLNSEARRELLDALHLDPEREDIKRQLRAVISRIEGGPSEGRVKQQSENSAARSASPPDAVVIETRSLAGFSKPVAEQFVRQIQPILSSRCATAGCHSVSQNPFQLVSTRNGQTFKSTPFIAERNLAAVLKQINRNSPDESPLLNALAGNHGGRSTPILRGRDGRRQMDVLTSWVIEAAGELNPGLSSPVTLQMAKTTAPRKTDGTAGSLSRRSATDNGESREADGPKRATEDLSRGENSAVGAADTSGTLHESGPFGERISTQESDSRILDEIAMMNRSDAFDPAVFNEKYHTKPTGTGELSSRKESR